MFILHGVALYTSAWIEIINDAVEQKVENVALYTSAWIEIERRHHE